MAAIETQQFAIDRRARRPEQFQRLGIVTNLDADSAILFLSFTTVW